MKAGEGDLAPLRAALASADSAQARMGVLPVRLFGGVVSVYSELYSQSVYVCLVAAGGRSAVGTDVQMGMHGKLSVTGGWLSCSSTQGPPFPPSPPSLLAAPAAGGAPFAGEDGS